MGKLESSYYLNACTTSQAETNTINYPRVYNAYARFCFSGYNFREILSKN